MLCFQLCPFYTSAPSVWQMNPCLFADSQDFGRVLFCSHSYYAILWAYSSPYAFGYPFLYSGFVCRVRQICLNACFLLSFNPYLRLFYFFLPFTSSKVLKMTKKQAAKARWASTKTKDIKITPYGRSRCWSLMMRMTTPVMLKEIFCRSKTMENLRQINWTDFDALLSLLPTTSLTQALVVDLIDRMSWMGVIHEDIYIERIPRGRKFLMKVHKVPSVGLTDEFPIIESVLKIKSEQLRP
ncbi:hypothetical protein DFS34DRAFT_624918 [Phlyctochytrium arcticum]|nr:hypothetical protein DFS34DRAFT_624918 [Phlyctochytrium arcticum]